MTDVENPKMAGSGDSNNDQPGDSVTSDTGGSNIVRKHRRAHSRNKSITGRQDFIEEIANSEFKQEVTSDAEDRVASDNEETVAREKDRLLPGQDLQDHGDSGTVIQDSNGGGHRERDETDALPPNLRYNCFDFFCTFISIITYIVDLVMDCVVAYYFYHLAVDHGIYHYWYFSLTLVFIVLPSLTMTGFSLRWYLMDSDNNQLPRVSMTRWLVRLVVLVLQLAPILRYVDSMRYGVKSRCAAIRENKAETEEERMKWRKERVNWYTLMVFEDADATLLRLYESFMESAPQLVLQLYILLKDPHASRIYPYKPPVDGLDVDHDHADDVVDESGVNPVLKLSILVMSVCSSLVSLAWSLVVYHRSLRYTYPEKKNISLPGTLFQFLWHFCSITARVLALSLFASALPRWIGPLCAAHWIIMASWIIFQRTAACNTKCEEFLFALVLGVIYIFMFFNAKEERTRYKYLLYYTFCFLENTAIIIIWFMSPSTNSTSWYVFPAMVGHYLAFFAGIMFMLCYYLWFHPTGGIDIPWPLFGGKESVVKERRSSREGVEMKVVMMRENRVIHHLDHDGDSVSESGTLDRFLHENSDKVAVRRFSSLPPGALYTYGRGSETRGARKLKYMGNKSQDIPQQQQQQNTKTVAES